MHRKHAIFDQKGSEVNGGKRLRDNPFELAVRNVKTTTTMKSDYTEECESSQYSADSTVLLTESQSTESSYESAEESRLGAGHSDRDSSVVTTHVDTEIASIEVKIRRKTTEERGETVEVRHKDEKDSHPVEHIAPLQKNTDGKMTKDQPPPPPINNNVVIRKSREVTRIESRSHGMPMVKPILAKQAELMNKHHPFLYPHFMRRTNVFNGEVKNVGMPRDHTSGTVFVELKAQCKWARLSVVPSLSADLHLARLCSSHLKERGRVLLINSQPHRTVVAFVAPPLEETNARLITVEKEGVYRGTVRNMPAPNETLQAKSLTPLWHTVHYTIALGKHVAVPFKIPGPKEIKIKYIRTKRGYATMTAAKSKYAETPKETVYRMTAAPKHTIRLSTVEDPNVHKVERVVVDAEGILHKKEHPLEVDETFVFKKTTREYAVRREHREVENTREHRYTKDFYAVRDGKERRETRQIAEERTTKDYSRSHDDQRLPRDFYPERGEKERGGDVNGERRDGRQPTVDVIARDKKREMQTNGESEGRHGKPAKITVDVDYDERSSADRRRDPKHHRRKHHHESKAHQKHKERKRREPRETRDEVGESSGGSVQVRVRQNGQLHETSFPPLLDSREKRERGESREKRAPSRENEGKKETTSEERRQRREQKHKEREERHRRRDERHREKARLREAEKKREERDGANLQLIGEEGEKKKKPSSVELIGRPKSDSGPGQSDKRDAIGKVPNSKEKTTTTATTGSGESKTPQRSKETVKKDGKEGDNSNNFGSEKNDEVANTEKKKGIARSEGSELAAPKKKDSTLATKEINPMVERRRKSAKLPPPLPAVPPLQQVLSGKSSAEMTKPEEQTGRMVTKASNIPERKPRRKYSAPPPYAPAPVPAQHQSAQLTVPSKTGEKHALLRTKVSKGKYKKSKENGGGSKEHGKGGAPAPAGILGSKNTQTTKKKSKKTEDTKKKAKKEKEKKEKEKKKKK